MITYHLAGLPGVTTLPRAHCKGQERRQDTEHSNDRPPDGPLRPDAQTVSNIISTVGTLLGFLVYFKTTMRTGNNFSSLIIRKVKLGVVPPGLLVLTVVPIILGDNHNNHCSRFPRESPAPTGSRLHVFQPTVPQNVFRQGGRKCNPSSPPCSSSS